MNLESTPRHQAVKRTTQNTTKCYNTHQERDVSHQGSHPASINQIQRDENNGELDVINKKNEDKSQQKRIGTVSKANWSALIDFTWP